MARKKRKKDTAKRPRRSARPPGLPNLPPSSLLELARLMEAMGGRLPPGGGLEEGPTDEAEALLRQAYGEPSPRRRVELARKALMANPNCSDAYVLLGDHADKPAERIDLLRQAVAVAERGLGERAFREDVGHFWGLLETRPYMRARFELALALWREGQRDEAITHLQDLVRLNPNDNQGARYVLLDLLLYQERNDDAQRLLDQYPEETTARWTVGKALLRFRRDGDVPEARAFLREAKRRNKYLVDWLPGDRPLPPEPPGMIEVGGESEAIECAGGAMPAWRATPGALEWLRATLQPAPKKHKRPSTIGPTPERQARLRALPQTDDIWAMDCRRFPGWLRSGNSVTRPWITLVLSRHHFVVGQVITDEPASAEALYDCLAQAMEAPLDGPPHRPAQLRVIAGRDLNVVAKALEELDIPCLEDEAILPMDAVLEQLVRHEAEKENAPGLLSVPGVSVELVGNVYAAAADFYEKAPWRALAYETPMRIECDRFPRQTRYGIVMGVQGVTLGFSLYDKLGPLAKLLRSDGDEAENAEQTSSTVVIFGQPYEMPVMDLFEAERHGWRVADPDAYPWMLRKDAGDELRAPSVEDLQWLEIGLRAAPELVGRRPMSDPTPETLTLAAPGRDVAVRMAWQPIE